MPKQTEFKQIASIEGLYEFTKGNLRSIAFHLQDKSICLVSPLAGTPESAWESLESLGEIKFITAPNHYHNKGLKEASSRFAKAQLCATSYAMPRLEKIAELKFKNINQLNKKLTNNISIVQPDGLKTGELWICINHNNDNALIAIDAFCGEKISKEQITNDKPQLLKTFPTYGINDAIKYHAWAKKEITSFAPNMLIPCHGAICERKQLDIELVKCLDTLV